MTERLRDLRLSTIRARLLAGFGISITLLLVAGVLGWFGLQRTNAYSERTVAELSAKTELVEGVVTAVLREVIGGMRYVQAGTLEEAQRYRSLAATADRALRSASSDASLSTRERLLLERIGQLQATLEVRIAAANALADAGSPARGGGGARRNVRRRGLDRGRADPIAGRGPVWAAALMRPAWKAPSGRASGRWPW